MIINYNVMYYPHVAVNDNNLENTSIVYLPTTLLIALLHIVLYSKPIVLSIPVVT